MPEKKRQHYIPQFYLRNFAREDKMLSILSMQGLIIDSAPYKRQCYSNYFYQSDDVEEALSKLESSVAPIILRLNNQNDVILSDIEKDLLRMFIVYQFFRTAGQVDYFIKTYGGLLSEFSKYYVSGGVPKSLSEEFLRKSNGKLLPLESLAMAHKTVPLINDLKLAVVAFSEKHFLISSDNPVILFNNYYKQCVGFSMAGLVMILPISPHKLLVVYDSKMYSISQKYGIEGESKYKDSLILNRLQLYNADKLAFGCNAEALHKLIKQLDSARKIKSKKDNSIISTLGPMGNEIIIEQGPWPLLDTELSFLHLIPKAYAIPQCNRDFFPREYDDGWNQRLLILKELPTVIKSSKPEEVPRDYSAHINLARNYWSMT